MRVSIHVPSDTRFPVREGLDFFSWQHKHCLMLYVKLFCTQYLNYLKFLVVFQLRFDVFPDLFLFCILNIHTRQRRKRCFLNSRKFFSVHNTQYNHSIQTRSAHTFMLTMFWYYSHSLRSPLKYFVSIWK